MRPSSERRKRRRVKRPRRSPRTQPPRRKRRPARRNKGSLRFRVCICYLGGKFSFPRSAWERTSRRSAARVGRDAERPHARSHAGAWERENHPSKEEIRAAFVFRGERFMVSPRGIALPALPSLTQDPLRKDRRRERALPPFCLAASAANADRRRIFAGRRRGGRRRRQAARTADRQREDWAG
jgi:hypothetical protein